MKKQVNSIISIASIMAAPANGSVHAINGSTDGTAADAVPDTPQNLTAIAAGPAQIILIWTAVTDVTRYHVYRSAAASDPYELIGLTAEPYFINQDLVPNTTYYYRVTAVAGDTESPLSNIAAATTLPAVPTPPTPENVYAQALNCTEISITWDISAGAEGYYVYRSESADGPYQLIQVTAAASYSDAGLSPYTMYHYLVQAYTGSQFSLPSVPVSAMTPSCGTPVPPCRQCCCPCCGCDPCGCDPCGCNPQNDAIGL